MTTTEKMYDLSFDIDGESINLEQDSGCGKMAYIKLHPCQLRLIAEKAGILNPSETQPKPSGLPAGLVRHLGPTEKPR